MAGRRNRRASRGALVGIAAVALLATACIDAPPPGPSNPPPSGSPANLISLNQSSWPPESPWTTWETEPIIVYPGGTTEHFSSVAVGDVIGNSQPEVVVGANNGIVYAFDLAGAVVATYNTGAGPVWASPTLTHLDGDGKLDVLSANGYSGWVVGFKGNSPGTILFAGNTGPDDQGLTNLGAGRGVIGTPAVGDIDRDGQPEIVSTSISHYVWAWNLDGTVVPGWPKLIYDSSWSSPALADLDGDGYLEVIFGGDMDKQGANQPPPYGIGVPEGGVLWVVRHNGADQPGFPRSYPRAFGENVIWSSPAVTDLDGDGSPDIVFGSGTNWPGVGHRVHAVNRFGDPLPGWGVFGKNIGAKIMASPAIGNLHGDWRPEIAVLGEDSFVRVLDFAGNILWTQCNFDDPSACPAGESHGSVIIADIDNDGTNEVINQASKWMRVFQGWDGGLEDAEPTSSYVWAPMGSPAVASINGETYLFQAVLFDDNHNVQRDSGDTVRIYAWRTGQPLGAKPWPTFRGRAVGRTGTPQ